MTRDPVGLSVGDLLWFIDEALDGLVQILDDLGDELANVRPPLDGANSAYALVTHCLGVMEYWGGQVIAGRLIERDREAEFEATGAVADLLERIERSREQLRADVAGLDGPAAPRGPVDDEDAVLPLGRTQSGAFVHILEELAQHRGQLEIGRDLLRAGRTATGPAASGNAAD